MVIKNAALLFKWWWRFSDEGNSLWKRVVCSIYGCDPNRLVGDHKMIKSGGPWKQIRDIPGLRDDISNTIARGFKKSVGNGCSILFWEEIWISDDKLCNIFPRLYSLSNQKKCFIADMGCWDGYTWCWNLEWRRFLFTWEANQMDALIRLLESVSLSQDKQESVIWTYNPNKKFAVKSFSLQVQKSLTNDDQTSLGAALAWKGVAPPHAKLTAWFLFHQRLNTKDRLCHLKNHPTYRSNLSFL